MSDKIQLPGILEQGYGIVPKKLMKIKFENRIGKASGRNVKLILCYLLSYSGTGASAFPSIRTISNDLEMSKAVVMESLRLASELSLISIEKNIKTNGSYANNIYKLDFLDPLFEYIEETESGDKFKIKVYGGSESDPGGSINDQGRSENDPGVGQNLDPNNNNIIITKNNNNSGATLRQQTIELLYSRYKHIYNNKLVIDKKEIGQIATIIKKATTTNKENPLEEIKRRSGILEGLATGKNKNYWKYSPGMLLSKWNELIEPEETDFIMEKYC